MLQAESTAKFWRKRHNVCPRDRHGKNIETIHFRMTPNNPSLASVIRKALDVLWSEGKICRGLIEKAGIVGSGGFLSCHYLEKAMATNSSTLAWKIPWTEEPGRLQPMGSHRVGHD